MAGGPDQAHEGPASDDDAGLRISHGAFHTVTIGPHRTTRTILGTNTAQRAAREADIHALLPETAADLRLPRLLEEPATANGETSYVVATVPGLPRDPDWERDRAELMRALDVLRTLPSSDLPQPRQWCGADALAHIVSDCFGTQLGQALHPAMDLIEAMLGSTFPHATFVHGDFGPHNVLWSGERLTGVIDFDHACRADPAMDVAPLVGVYGARILARNFDSQILDRAMLHRSTLALQVAASAHTNGLPELRDHALRNVVARWHSGTSYSPDGARPWSV